MGNPYTRILANPGALPFSATGLIARLPMAMTGLGIILMVENTFGSYALAGAVSAAYIIAVAICAPFLSRLVDRHGQARVMRPAIAIFNVGLAGLVAATMAGLPTALLYASAALAGAATGSIGALVRARWSMTVTDNRDLHTAYALESALDEVVFVIGPVLATLLATSVAPPAGVVASMFFSIVGGYWFLSLRTSEPPAIPRLRGKEHRGVTMPPDIHGRPDVPVLRLPAMWAVIAVMLSVGVIFGAIDVSTVATSAQFGKEPLAGVVLGVFAMGSLISGLIYGARAWRGALDVRFAVGVIGLAAGASLLLLTTSLVSLAIIGFITGTAIAPTFVNSNAIVQQVVHASRLTEGLTWTGTSNAAGVSIGSALAGSVIDGYGGHAGFAVAIGGAILATIVALSTLPIIRRSLNPITLTWKDTD